VEWLIYGGDAGGGGMLDTVRDRIEKLDGVAQ
jgi:hypothetical protein